MSIAEIFEKHNDEYLKFERVENPKSKRPDLHAFILLDELYPGDQNMIGSAEYDEIWLDVEDEQLQEMDEIIVIELTRCGVRYDSELDCLAMFA